MFCEKKYADHQMVLIAHFPLLSALVVQRIPVIFMCVIPVVCVTSKEGGEVKQHN
jgi:hypothetical protein